MNFYTLNDIELTGDIIRGFAGVNRSAAAGEREFADCENLDASYYPGAAPRNGKIRLRSVGNCGGALMGDRLATVREGEVYSALYWGESDTGLRLSAGEKQLVPFGTKIIVFPDNAYYDTYDGSHGSLEASFTTAEGVSLNYALCRADGTLYTYQSADSAPSGVSDGALWCDTSSGTLVLKQYSANTEMWSEVGSVYIKISYPSIGKAFSRHDGVKISSSIVPELNGQTVLWEAGDDFIVVSGIIDTEKTQTTPLKIERRVPKIDFALECGNRLWACRWGLDNEGNFVNEIYASKLGDPFNWSCYMGLSTDSYAASVGSDGAFTGVAPFGSGVLFFKENSLHRLRGSTPDSFSITSENLPGIAAGCGKSAAFCGGTLYYLSRDGVMAYDGTYPVCVSEPLGNFGCERALAAATTFEYTLYTEEKDGAPRLYVYSRNRGIWNPQSTEKLDALFSVGKSVCCIGGGYLYLFSGDEMSLPAEFSDSSVRQAERVKWFAETGELGADGGGRHVTKLQLRMRGERGCPVRIQMKTERHSDWESVGVITPFMRRTYTLPIITGRCDHVKLRLSGEGDFILYSIGRFSERAEI